MYVIAFIGKSGTGKSYKALKIAYENDVNYLIDDGLLIYKNKVLEGKSAKRANSKIEAVKIAIFEDEKERKNMSSYIKLNNIEKILIIGTSQKMINKIVERLELGKIDKKIYIEDVSTEEEIKKSIEIRNKKGTHTIPLPMPEVKLHFSGLFKNSIKILLKKEDKHIKEVEKTVVRPSFSCYGNYYISSKVIYQIIDFESSKFVDIKHIHCTEIKKLSDGIEINLVVEIQNNNIYDTSLNLQQKLVHALENITFLNILKINIYVSKFYQYKK